MSEEKKNGSAASPAAGTVSHNLSVSNTTISSQLYQGEIYGELEQMAVDEVIGRLQAGGKLYTATLRKIATEVQRVMRSQVAILSLPVSKGGRGLRWTVPKTISPVQCAMVLMMIKTVRLVCTPEEVERANPSGVLAAYYETGVYAGIYREIGLNQLDAWATEFAGAVDKKWREEFKAAICAKAKPVCECNNPDYIFFKSKILDYKTKTWIPFSPDIVSLRKIPFDIPTAEPAVPVHVKPDGTTIDFWQWLDSLAPYEGGRDLLVKLAGAVVRYNYNWRVMVTLFNSSGKNGKSTFIRMLKACVGRGNCMSSTMGQLCDDRFALANLPGTVLVTCEDSDSGTYIRSTSRIKCIISHDPVVVERKGQDTFTYTPACMIVSASNDLPRTKDKTPAWQDRNIYVPFTAEFKGVADPTIASEWVVSEEFCQYMLYQALIKMDNYYELPEPDMAVALKQEFMAENDSVIEFLEWFEDLGTIDFLPNGYAWYLYREWLPKHRPNTSLPNEKAFLKHLAEVAVNSGRWLQPKEAGGRSCRFSVGAWCHCSDDVLDANVDRYSEPKTRGIVRKEIYEYCQKHKVVPHDMTVKDYDAMRKSCGLERMQYMTEAEVQSKNVIPFKQA